VLHARKTLGALSLRAEKKALAVNSSESSKELVGAGSGLYTLAAAGKSLCALAVDNGPEPVPLAAVAAVAAFVVVAPADEAFVRLGGVARTGSTHRDSAGSQVTVHYTTCAVHPS